MNEDKERIRELENKINELETFYMFRFEWNMHKIIRSYLLPPQIKDVINDIKRLRGLKPYEFKNSPLETIWGLLVLEYGKYRTSPETGWIERENIEKVCSIIRGYIQC